MPSVKNPAHPEVPWVSLEDAVLLAQMHDQGRKAKGSIWLISHMNGEVTDFFWCLKVDKQSYRFFPNEKQAIMMATLRGLARPTKEPKPRGIVKWKI